MNRFPDFDRLDEVAVIREAQTIHDARRQMIVRELALACLRALLDGKDVTRLAEIAGFDTTAAVDPAEETETMFSLVWGTSKISGRDAFANWLGGEVVRLAKGES